jgi:pimeloyl-[acyl-carrier protein] methyl ester esterase
VSHNGYVIVVLLPGMDGTAALFEPFVRELPRNVEVVSVKYPAHIPLTYEQLANRVLSELPAGKPYILVAESFSGPVALRLASPRLLDMRAIVLVASFVSRPLGRWGECFARLPLRTVFRLKPPAWVLRWLLMDSSTPPEFVSRVGETISKVRPEVMAARTKEALRVDCTDAARTCPVRLVFVNGDKDRLLSKERRGSLYGSETVLISAPHFLLQCAPKPAVAAMNELGLFDDMDIRSLD